MIELYITYYTIILYYILYNTIYVEYVPNTIPYVLRTQALVDFVAVDRMAIHRELPWARSMSNEDFALFMFEQSWASGADLEAHSCSGHARRFNDAILKQRTLPGS